MCVAVPPSVSYTVCGCGSASQRGPSVARPYLCTRLLTLPGTDQHIQELETSSICARGEPTLQGHKLDAQNKCPQHAESAEPPSTSRLQRLHVHLRPAASSPVLVHVPPVAAPIRAVSRDSVSRDSPHSCLRQQQASIGAVGPGGSSSSNRQAFHDSTRQVAGPCPVDWSMWSPFTCNTCRPPIVYEKVPIAVWHAANAGLSIPLAVDCDLPWGAQESSPYLPARRGVWATCACTARAHTQLRLSNVSSR